MNVYLVIAALFAVGLICQYGIAKHFENINAGSIKKRISCLSLAAIFKQIGDYTLFAGKIYLLVVLVLGLLRVLGKGLSADQFASVQHSIENASLWLKPISSWAGIVIMVSTILAIVVLMYRRHKREHSDAAQEQFITLVREYNEGLLEPLPPTKEMGEVETKVLEVISWINVQHEAIKDQPDEYIDAYLKNANEALDAFRGFYARLDIERRINLKQQHETEQTMKGQVLSFITSQGFFDTSSKIKGWTGKALSVIAFSAMLGVQIGTAANIASTNMSLDVMQKRINDAQQRLGSSNAENKLTSGDERILDEMAADFELAIGNNPIWAKDDTTESNDEAANNFLYESLVVRELILKHFVATIGERANSTDFDTYTSLDDDQYHAKGGYRQSAIKYSIKDFATQSESQPYTELGKEYRNVMKEKVAMRNPVQWGNLKEKFIRYKESFHQPVSFSNLTGKLWCNVTNDISGNLARFGENELGKAANEIVEEIGKDNLKLIHDNLIYKHISSVCGPTPYADAWKDIKNMNTTGVFPNYEMATTIRDRLPTMEGSEVRILAENVSPGLKHNGKPVNITKAEAALSKLEPEARNLNRQSLQSFDDYFPAHNTEFTKSAYETESFRGSGKSRIANVGKNVGSDFAGNLAKESVGFFKSSRARSVRALRGFSRIGGVLIGEMPNKEQDINVSLNITDIGWSTTPSGVRFRFKTATGTSAIFGPYPADIVLSALVYAADGRPTTVTMVSAPPIVSLKILLHPALVNSQIGLDAIDLDRFVDTYQSSEIKNERDFVNLCQILYSLTHRYRLGLVLGENGVDTMVKIQAKSISYCEANFSVLRGRSLSKDNCPFYTKQEFYETELVDIVKTSLDARPRSMQELNRLLISKVKERWNGKIRKGEGDYVFVDYHKTPILASSFQVWSGVREADYIMSPPLTLAKVKEKKFINYPFNFIIQTAFTSPTLKQALEENPSDYIDEAPWQFPELEKMDAVNSSVLQGVRLRGGQRALEIYTRMSQFIELQRLFRLAFEGRLGHSFPLARLITIAKTFDKAVPYVKTPEWNYNPVDSQLSILIPAYKDLQDALNLRK